MPRKHTVRNFKPDKIYHLHNHGANNYPIFHDDRDFSTFLGYLEDYLSPPPDKDSLKVTVEFNGKSITGVPRQPNNYYGEIQLLAFGLNRDEFHLVMHQRQVHSIPKFMQSLNTRYSMYFNKRHQRTGSPFVGKYKAIEIDLVDAWLLSGFIHRKMNHQTPADEIRSSYQDHLGETTYNWLKPESIQDFFFQESIQKMESQSVVDFTFNTQLNFPQLLGEKVLVDS